MIKNYRLIAAITGVVLAISAIAGLLGYLYASNTIDEFNTRVLEYKKPIYKLKAGKTAKNVIDDFTDNFFEYQVLRIYLHSHPELTAIQKGEYLIDGKKSLKDLLTDMVAGNVVQKEYPVFAIIEGTNIAKIINKIKARNVYDRTYADLAKNPKALIKKSLEKATELYELIGDEVNSLEGLLSPATYPMYDKEPVTNMLSASMVRQLTYLKNEWENRKKSDLIKTPYEALILASLIEKESGEGMALKEEVTKQAQQLQELEAQESELSTQVTDIMMQIPQIIDPSVPIGKDDTQNVEIERFGEPVVPDFEVPYHTDIMEKLNGIDLDSARKVAGNGFYYLMGDIARLHSAVIAYARDFMIDRGFTYCVPPFMIRSNVVTGVMSFAEMDSMMYKIEGEDLYLIGTSEHSMIGKFIDTINKEENLPYTLTSYSPCFRKEKGAHGIEERGVYRIHQFEKQEMIVVCKPEDSKMWFDKLWQNTVDLFRSLDIPVRTLECCSGDLADLKVRSLDVEAWSPRQKKYFEVGSCSNLGDAQARRLKIRVNGGKNGKYFAHTLNNTVVAPPRMLIAFLENNLNEDGSINIPVALRPYMGGKEIIK